jgi:hypothetical protein
MIPQKKGNSVGLFMVYCKMDSIFARHIWVLVSPWRRCQGLLKNGSYTKKIYGKTYSKSKTLCPSAEEFFADPASKRRPRSPELAAAHQRVGNARRMAFGKN